MSAALPPGVYERLYYINSIYQRRAKDLEELGFVRNPNSFIFEKSIKYQEPNGDINALEFGVNTDQIISATKNDWQYTIKSLNPFIIQYLTTRCLNIPYFLNVRS